MATVSVIGLGKLGSPLLAVLAAAGHSVIGVDLNLTTVDALNAGRAPVQEPELQDLLTIHRRQYRATTDTLEAVRASEATFVIVPTPSGPDGGFTLDYLGPVAREIGTALRDKEDGHLIVIVSTVMPGQTAEIARMIEQQCDKREGEGFHLVYSPTFIALGSVIRNLRYPDYVLVGLSSWAARETMRVFWKLFNPLVFNEAQPRVMLWPSAEIAKIAQNAYITMKITFANQLSDLCGAVPGANVDDVTAALGSDTRIGAKYLKAGTAFGGPCFPRDSRALARIGMDSALMTDRANTETLFQLANTIDSVIAKGRSSIIGLLGLSYKPGTPSIEESASLRLLGFFKHWRVVVYDPLAMEEARAVLGDTVEYAASAQDCVERATVIVLMHPDMLVPLSAFDGKVVIDPWRVLPTESDYASEMPINITHIPLGVGPALEASEAV